jgi:hypothetical protein
MAFRGRWLAVLALVAGLGVAAPSLNAFAADPAAADVQWAQGILKGKGLYSGRQNGEWNDATRSGLSAYQKAEGLKQTGQLDKATVDHMLAARQATASPTMGNLAGPNGKPPVSHVSRDVEPPKPLASPTTRVEAHGSAQGVDVLGGSAPRSSGGSSGGTAPAPSVSRNAAPAASTAAIPAHATVAQATAPRPASRGPAPGEPVPQAAPRTGVESAAQAPQAGVQMAPDPQQPSGFIVPQWVRAAVIGVLGGTFGVAGLMFWLSGRRPSRKPDASPASVGMRQEPSFDGGRSAAGPAPTLRATRPL